MTFASRLRLLRLLLRTQVSSLLLVVPFLFGDDFHCLAEGVDGYLDDLCLLLLVYSRRE